VDRPFELAGQFVVTPRLPEALEAFLRGTEDLPEERLPHVAITVLVRMREAVAAGRRRSTDRPEFGLVVAQTVAHVVEPDRMGEVAIRQTDHMAPGRKGPALPVHPMIGGELFDHPGRDHLAKLIQHTEAVLGWFWFFHTGFLGRKPARANLFFLNNPSIWYACESKLPMSLGSMFRPKFTLNLKHPNYKYK